jgi:hypothetical protein
MPGHWWDGDPKYKYGKTDPHCFCISATNFGYMVYWLQGYFVCAKEFTKETKKRNYLTDKVTKREEEKRKKYYKDYGVKLSTYDAVAAEGMGGWEGEGDEEGSNYEDAGSQSLTGTYNGDVWWEPRTGALRKDAQYRLPEEVLLHRWALAKKRQGVKRLPYAAGIGLYDKFGACLPQFSFGVWKVIPKKRRNAPEICLYPASSIYLVVEDETPVRMGRGVIGDLDFRRLCLRPLTIAVTRHSATTAHELASILTPKPITRQGLPPRWSCAAGCFYIKTASGWRPLGGPFIWGDASSPA